MASERIAGCPVNRIWRRSATGGWYSTNPLTIDHRRRRCLADAFDVKEPVLKMVNFDSAKLQMDQTPEALDWREPINWATYLREDDDE